MPYVLAGMAIASALKSAGDRRQAAAESRQNLRQSKADKIGEFIQRRQQMEQLSRGLGAIGGF